MCTEAIKSHFLSKYYALCTCRFIVQLSTKSSDLQDTRFWETVYCKQQDRYYALPSSVEAEEMRAKRMAASKGRQLVRRPIDHPMYKHEDMETVSGGGWVLTGKNRPIKQVMLVNMSCCDVNRTVKVEEKSNGLR